MIGRKVSQIRSGKIELDQEGFHPEAFLSSIDLHSIRTTIPYYLKIYGHRIVLLSLKQWIRFSFWIKEKKENKFPSKNKSIDDVKTVNTFSKFLTTVSDYKNNLRGVAKKVKEREERKREDF